MSDGTRAPDQAGRVSLPAWRIEDSLLELPLIIADDPAYAELDVEPFATGDEVRWAKSEMLRSLAARENQLNRELNEIYARVPDLRETYARVQKLEQAGVEADATALLEAQRRLAELEEAASRSDPDFRRKRQQVAGIQEQTERLNRQALDKPDDRAAYDRAHPPLALLQVADYPPPGFAEVRTAFTLLRREVAAFLQAQGDDVFHPSDLTRDDFVADFTYNPLLDGEV